MSSCAEWVGLASDIVVATAAGVGALVAWKGLGAWRHQLKGSNEYDLARRLLKSTYQLRDAMAAARSPVMFGGEMPRPSAEAVEGMTAEQLRFFGTSGAYTERYRVVQEHRRALELDLLEAEALWGEGLDRDFQPLFKLQHELWMAFHLYMRSINPNEPGDSRDAYAKLLREKHERTLYNLSEGKDKPDEFSAEVLAAIAVINKELRPHLARS